jgi:hypothetical protein
VLLLPLFCLWRQLKALPTSLDVAGLAGAVEKSDLVGLLVEHLRLS